MKKDCVAEPALVTHEVLQAAQDKTEELFACLVAAKNEWQYALHNDEEAKAYEKVLRIKAEYAEWRAMTARLAEILAGGGLGAAEPPCDGGKPSPAEAAQALLKRRAGRR